MISETVYNNYFENLIKGEKQKCESIVQELLNQKVGILDLFENIFRKSLYQVGDLWAKGMISVAEEHIATAITENLLAIVLAYLGKGKKEKGKVLVACITADLHQIGAKMVSGLFEYHGWASFFLGANMPITDLINSIERLQPDVICLSFTLLEHVKTLEVTVNEIRTMFPTTPIIAGGRASAAVKEHSKLLQTEDFFLVDNSFELENLIKNLHRSS